MATWWRINTQQSGAPDSYDQAEQLDSGAQTVPSRCNTLPLSLLQGLILCIRASLFTGVTSWHQCLVRGIGAYCTHVALYFWFVDPCLVLLTETHLGNQVVNCTHAWSWIQHFCCCVFSFCSCVLRFVVVLLLAVVFSFCDCDWHFRATILLLRLQRPNNDAAVVFMSDSLFLLIFNSNTFIYRASFEIKLQSAYKDSNNNKIRH